MTEGPDISVIIPVLHEGERIHQTLAQLSQQTGEVAWEVLVVDGDALGSTISLLSPEVTGVRSLRAPRNRSCQMNAGARQAQGRILVFLHADTQLPPQALSQIANLMEHPNYVGGAFDLGIDSPHWLLRIVARMASWRSRLTRIPTGIRGFLSGVTIFSRLAAILKFP